jgi:hypothetical protein
MFPTPLQHLQRHGHAENPGKAEKRTKKKKKIEQEEERALIVHINFPLRRSRGGG